MADSTPPAQAAGGNRARLHRPTVSTESIGMVAGFVFCEIVQGRVPASLVHQDAATVAFMDLRQPNADVVGHVLVVPRRHTETLAG